MLELIAQAGARIQRKRRHQRIASRSQRAFHHQSFIGYSTRSAYQGQHLIALQKTLHRLVPSVVVRRIRKAVESQCAVETCRSRGNRQGTLNVSARKNRRARYGGYGWESRDIHVACVVGDSSPPTGGAGAIGNRCLPLILLIGVGEEVQRHANRAVSVARSIGGLHQWAHVADDAQFAHAPELVETSQARV